MKKILLADDDESVRRMVARVLESAGYQVLVAGNGREAISSLREERPDLIVLDSDLEARNGSNGLSEIRQLAPAVPVVATTGWSESSRPVPPQGIDALLEKPLDLRLLLEVISRLLAPVPSSA